MPQVIELVIKDPQDSTLANLRDKADHIASRIAAEAVIEAGFGVDGKGRGMFFMEGEKLSSGKCTFFH
jgi:hypothetical protein